MTVIAVRRRSGTRVKRSNQMRRFLHQAPNAQAEDEGWLLSVVYNRATEKSEVIVVDAMRVDAGPIARVLLPRRVPFGFHGMWVPQESA